VITTLTGENDVLRQEALGKIVGEFVSQHTDIGLERLDGEDADYERMHTAVQSLPFLASRKLIVLRKPGSNKEFTERIEQFVEDIADTNDVVLVEPKLDKRSSYYKLLKKITNYRDFPLLDANGLMRFASDYAKSHGGQLRSGEARLLVDRVGVNQLVVRNEVDKLLAYNPIISRPNIELLTERTPQSSVFELLDAAFSGNVKRAMSLYDEQRDMRVEPQQIIAMIVWQLYILAVVKAGGSRSAESIAKEAKLSPFVVRKSQDLSRRISASRIKKLVTDLRVFDVRLKSEGISADEVVRYYLMDLATR
jgi:DNA polymerase-3 subunit delta